jgi:DNA gyrase subunit A
VTNRGGKGVKTINITEKTGNLVAIKSVTDANDLMIITRNGITIRLNVADLRLMGRATQGVRLINIQENDDIAAVTKVDHDEDEALVKAAEGTVIEAVSESGVSEASETPEEGTSTDTTPADDNQ